jgi:hypothetical protein
MRTMLSILLVGCVAAGTTGCQSTGEAAGLGALIGAGVGAAIGATNDEAAAGAIIGAGLGAAAGAVAHDVRKTRATKYRSAEDTARIYEYTPSEGESLVLEEARIYPGTVQRGDMIDSSVQYALLGSGAGVPVLETRAVKRNDVLVAQISSQRFTRNDGAWVSSQAFRIPEDWQPGEYTLEQVVETAQSRVMSVSRFTVR